MKTIRNTKALKKRKILTKKLEHFYQRLVEEQINRQSQKSKKELAKERFYQRLTEEQINRQSQKSKKELAKEHFFQRLAEEQSNNRKYELRKREMISKFIEKNNLRSNFNVYETQCDESGNLFLQLSKKRGMYSIEE